MNEAGSPAVVRRSSKLPYILPLVALVLVAGLLARKRNSFPYSGIWTTEASEPAAPLSFQFGALGGCSYKGGPRRQGSGSCSYTTVEGSAIVEYIYDFRNSGKATVMGYGRTWYKVKLTPTDEGRKITLHFLDGADLRDGEAAGEARQIPVLGKAPVLYTRNGG